MQIMNIEILGSCSENLSSSSDSCASGVSLKLLKYLKISLAISISEILRCTKIIGTNVVPW